jgi:hypothetical protein
MCGWEDHFKILEACGGNISFKSKKKQIGMFIKKKNPKLHKT